MNIEKIAEQDNSFKEFLLDQIHFVKSSKIGPHIIFDDEPDSMYCPHCGKKLQAEMKDGYSLKCDCTQYNADSKLLSALAEVEVKEQQLQEEKNAILEAINKKVELDALSICVQHYLKNKKDVEFDVDC